MTKFWKFRNEAGSSPELVLYGPISESSWWGDEVTPKQFSDDLKALGNVSDINVRINSGGGDVFAATAIYTALKSHAANITVTIDGLAASAATIIAMAGDTVRAPSNAVFMIHDPMLVLFGYYNAEDMEKMADTLETVKDSIINAYVSKTGRDRKELAKMMSKETWMTADEAKAEGFVDEIMFDDAIDASITNDKRFMVVNSVAHDLSRFQTRPVMRKHRKPINDSSPAYPVGSRVRAAIDPPHMDGQDAGEVREAVLTWVYGIVFDGMEDMGVHKWYVESELEAAEDENDDDNAQNAKKKKMDMPMDSAKEGNGLKTIDELKKEYPDLYNQVAAAERERLKSIDDISATIAPELVNKAKYEQPMTAQDLAFEALKADAAKGKQFTADRAAETQSGADVGPGTPPNPEEQNAAVIDKIAAAMNQKRKEVK